MNNTTENIAAGIRVHWVVVQVCTKMGGEILFTKIWKGLPWEVRTKWDWYFKYRAALAQVKHPRAYVDFRWGSEPAEQRTVQQELAKKLSSKKAQLTKWKNALQQHVEHWNELFPVTEDGHYIKAIGKVEALECEVRNLENQLS